jgi:hypothetical protein
VLGGLEGESAEALAGEAESAGFVLVNVGPAAERMGAARCAPRVVHVAPGEAAQRAAADTRPGERVRAVLWHPDLFRFGAEQLNDRFSRRFSRPMDGAAWAGWVGVKLLLEAALRAPTTEAAGLVAFLEGRRASFDGHKGRALAFRAEGHELRQPLYLVEGETDPGRLVGEVPAPEGEPSPCPAPPAPSG